LGSALHHHVSVPKIINCSRKNQITKKQTTRRNQTTKENLTMKTKLIKHCLAALTLAAGFLFASGCETEHEGKSEMSARSSGEIEGRVLIAGQPVVGSTVTLYAAGSGAPTQLAQGKTGDDGQFELNAGSAPGGSVVYVVAEGPKDGVALMSLLGSSWPEKITVNELTTVASSFCAARFINGEAISGNPLGLHIAAGNVPNLVDPETGGWGKVLVDPLNSYMTSTLATLNTLGSLISACATTANDDWRARFLKAATPPGGVTPMNTLEAMAGIAREPWAAPAELYALFDQAYPQPKDGFAPGCAVRAVSGLCPARFRAQPLLQRGWQLCRRAADVRQGGEPLERAKLAARLAIRSE
jgi:hypothetical protein